ncbi:nitrous oxide reductase accessory protein NosL [Sulfurospirillum sp. hDNRA2]|jgi:copper chaperone NosL|uniref:nitrous oxide reductase accessory protein NosL n=1 Tax=Sulfurospirillum sp. hDNRA2 TaxID=3237298 RepID=UPI0020B850E8|nr:nitrous oxide reductase accessory protein NosL [Sulfurospirillum sp. DNRA8]MCP3651645.1 nitrous oxide reductase accessory protein NosL [Sulfurospirillum sp. DNRA8]MCR1810492.1 nitrous oxide reductase accessory protein NosL [Sulfurospirillum sp. DNRA8]
MMKKLCLILVTLSALFGAKVDIPKDAQCLIRKVQIYQHPEWASTITLRSKEHLYFSSPKSMFEFYFESSRWPEYVIRTKEDMQIYVTDYDTMEKIIAQEAYFVYGSSKTSISGDDLPAFSTKAQAEAFVKKFGGTRILDFAGVSDALINLLNNRLR